MSHLETLIVEYLDWQEYLVRRNLKVGRLGHGGWEMELDVIGYNPHTKDLVHYEPSIDAHSWETREERYKKKFEAAKKHIFREVFSWLSPETPLRQIAVFVAHPVGRDTIAGAQIVSVDELVAEIRTKVIEEGAANKSAIPEIYPLLRVLQRAHPQECATMANLTLRQCLTESIAPVTVRAYTRDLVYFWTWARVAQGCKQEAYPVPLAWILGYTLEHFDGLSPERLAGIIAAGQSPSGRPLAIATLRRYLVPLSVEHTIRGVSNPCKHPTFLFLMRRISQRRDRMKHLRLPITADILVELINVCGADRRGERDRALLMVGFAGGGRRRSELAALSIEHLERVEGGYIARLPIHKTVGLTHEPLEFPIFDAAARQLDRWLHVSGIHEGRVFRGIDQYGRLYPGIGHRTISRIIKRLARWAGLPESFYSPHSLRSGFITQAARDRIPLTEAMAISGHRSMTVATGYYKASRLIDNPAAHLSRDIGDPVIQPSPV